MEYVYADLVRKGKKTLDKVPPELRDAVKHILDGWGVATDV